ncbi:MAG: hypothetical protein ACR2F6_00105 [Mycobacteriales bacterium]
MPDVPRYPGDAPEPDGEPGSSPDPRRSMSWWWIAGGAVLVLFVVLHLTGVLGPGGH